MSGRRRDTSLLFGAWTLEPESRSTISHSALVWRHPLNWGFVLDSPWSLMTSFAMPPRRAVNSTDRQERELARSLRNSRLRHTVQDAPLKVDVYRSGLTVPDVAPAPELFLREGAQWWRGAVFHTCAR